MVEVNIDDGPCGWVIDPAVTGCCENWATYTPEQRERGAILAASWMWAATGRLYGQCETDIEVCADRHRLPTYRAYPATGYVGAGFAPYIADGVWWNAPVGAGTCCRDTCELHLPGHVASSAAVLEVTVAGDILDPAAYQVYDHEALMRIDGQCWPVCCNAPTSDNAVAITYLRGRPVPPDVKYAADALACEFAAACAGDDACRLPRQVSSMTQMGTTVDFSDLPGVGSPYMAIGIDEVDQVIKARNPYGMTRPVRLTNPNRPPVRRPM